jgi:hypothetical protein
MEKKRREVEVEREDILTRTKASLFSRIGGTVPVPDEFLEYRMCRAFNCLPHQLDELDEDTFALFREFVRIEMEAANIVASPSANV